MYYLFIYLLYYSSCFLFVIDSDASTPDNPQDLQEQDFEQF
jgi:hypothetical protein